MQWLTDLINLGGYWAPLKIIFPLVMIVSGIWIYIDAQTRTGNGCFWGALAFAVPPIGVPLYYIGLLTMHIRDNDPAFKRQRAEEKETAKKEHRRYKMMGDIERAREEQARKSLGGTMFDPASGIGINREGHKHFTDQRAEYLIQSLQFEAAWDYLADLFVLAREENDARSVDTYRYYIARLPDGLERLRELERPDKPGPTS